MLKVGLTGGIGCGKSTAVDAFRAFGVPIIDADQIAKDLVEPGQSALTKIAEQFGSDILLENGELNRSLLKEKVFSDKDLLLQLEAILHPMVKDEIKRQFLEFAKPSQNTAYVIADVPLLVEKGYEEMFDRVTVVDCLPEQQLSRVHSRDHLDKNIIESIMRTQAARNERLDIATDILDNTQNKDILLDQINRLHLEILALS